MLRGIMTEGVDKGDFDPEKTTGVYSAMIMLFQGIELSYMRNNFSQFGIEPQQMRQYIKQYVLSGIKKH